MSVSDESTEKPDSNRAEYIEDIGDPPPPSDPHSLVPPGHGPTQLLDDQQLKNGGMVPVQAWMRTKQSENALRIKRHREKQEAKGLKQINVAAPEAAHSIIRELADKTKAGVPLADVINEIAARVSPPPETNSFEDIEQLSARNTALEARIKQLEDEVAAARGYNSQPTRNGIQICDGYSDQAPGMQNNAKVGWFTNISQAISNFRIWCQRLLALREKIRL